MRGHRWLWAVAFVVGCGGAAPAQTAPAADEPSVASAAEAAPLEENEPRDAGPDDAASSPSAAKDGSAAYAEPPPVVVRRYHVFATMEARVKKKVTITSLLETAADDAEELAPGMEALLEHKPAGGDEWVPVADVTVVRLTTRGSRAAGTERQVIELEIRAEHAAAAQKGKLSPFNRKGRVRLQVDRQVAGR
jgi:hypothetical protein